MNVQKQKKNENIALEKLNFSNNNNNSNLFNHTTFNFLKPIIFYKYYRIFLENKIIGIKKIKKNDIFPIKAAVLTSLKSRNGYMTGFSSFFIAANLPNIFSKIYDNLNHEDLRKIHLPHIVLLFPTFILSYPFLINSNRKALNDYNYLSLKNPINIFKLVFNKNNYRGIYYHFLSSIIYYIPVANLYFNNRLESIRFTYVFGKNELGLKFSSYKETQKYLVNNNSITKGRGSFNMYIMSYYMTIGILFYEEYKKGI